MPPSTWCAAVAVPHAISASPRPGEFEALGDYVRDVTNAADRWFKAVGGEACSNSTDMQLDLFDSAFFGAVDGFGLWAIENAADAVSDEARRSNGARYCRSRRSYFQMAGGA